MAANDPRPPIGRGVAGSLPTAHYKIFGQMQYRKSVAKDQKMVAIVLLLPLFFG
jgi:hypothetical protein